MAFTPLTRDQYQKALDAGFSPDQILQNEQRRKAEQGGGGGPPQLPSTDLPLSHAGDYSSIGTPGTLLGAFQNVVGGTANIAKNMAIGIGSEVGKAGIGAVQSMVPGAMTTALGPIAGPLANKAVGSQINQGLETVKKAVYEDPFKKDLSTISGNIGKGIGGAAVFAAPSSPIAKAQEAMTVAKTAPWVLKALSGLGKVGAESVGTGATQYTATGGDTKSATQVGLGAGALSFITRGAATALSKAVPQDVMSNIKQFITYQGKGNVKGAATDAKAIATLGGFTNFIKQNAEKPFTVIGPNGAEEWNPRDPNMIELPQVLWQSMRRTFQKMTDIATKAGDNGAFFGQQEFDAVKKDLTDKFISNTRVDPAFTAKAKAVVDWIDKQGTLHNGHVYFPNTSPVDIQEMIQSVNKGVAKGETTAAHEVASTVSVKMREILDKKIENALPGAEYQGVRDEYSMAKTMEKDILKRYNQAASQSGGAIPAAISGLAVIDMIQAALTANPALAARGVGIMAVKSVYKYLRNPENAMKRAFKILVDGQEGVSSPTAATNLGKRFFGFGDAVAPVTRGAAGAGVGGPVK